MVAIGFSVAAMIRVSNAKGMKDYKQLITVARSIFLFTIMVETFFGLVFVISHQFLPHLFLNMSDVSQQLDNTEIIFIASKLLLVAAVFQISDGIQVVVFCGILDSRISDFVLFRKTHQFGCNWNLDRTFIRIDFGSFVFVYSFCEID